MTGVKLTVPVAYEKFVPSTTLGITAASLAIFITRVWFWVLAPASLATMASGNGSSPGSTAPSPSKLVKNPCDA